MKITALAFLAALSACAQTPNPLPTGSGVTYTPTYFVGAGVSYNRFAAPSNNTAGWATVGLQIGGPLSRLYSVNTVDITPATTSMRIGLGYILAQFHGISLLTHVDGGFTTVNSAALGTFSGGAMAMYDLGHIRYSPAALKHIQLVGVVRIVAVTAVAIEPVYEFGFGKTF